MLKRRLRLISRPGKGTNGEDRRRGRQHESRIRNPGPEARAMRISAGPKISRSTRSRRRATASSRRSNSTAISRRTATRTSSLRRSRRSRIVAILYVAAIGGSGAARVVVANNIIPMKVQPARGDRRSARQAGGRAEGHAAALAAQGDAERQERGISISKTRRSMAEAAMIEEEALRGLDLFSRS